MKAYIYCIRSPHTDEIYIGSTIQKLSKRMGGHREKYKKYLNGLSHYVTSYRILEYGDAYIELIETIEVEDKQELRKIEGQYMRNNNKCINKCIAGRTKQEHYEDNRDKIIKKKKEHYEDNKKSIVEKQKKYYENKKDWIAEKRKEVKLCECGKTYTVHHKLRHVKSKYHLENV